MFCTNKFWGRPDPASIGYVGKRGDKCRCRPARTHFLDRGSSKAAMVDLRGRISNREVREDLALAAQAVAHVKINDGSTASPPSVRRRWRIVDRLGEQIIDDLYRDSHAGASKRELAERYGVSLSSVKRVLKRSAGDSSQQ